MQLALGTVQFGIAYGIAGRGEAVPEAEVRAILEHAAAHGVKTLDTAAAYGDIETRLARLSVGLPLHFISKVPSIDEKLDPTAAAELALSAARRSRARLGSALRGLMLHRAEDLEGARGEAVWRVLMPWARDEGIALGASCYTPSQAALLATRLGITLCQVPGNAFDQRIAETGYAAALASVEVHLRSTFLQGLLLMRPTRAIGRFPMAKDSLLRWHAWIAERGLSTLEAALSIVKSFSAVSTIVVGVDNLSQWREITDAWRVSRPLSAPELAVDQACIIDPRLWSAQA